MTRWHLYFMGLLATGYGAVVVADYAMVAYKMQAYLDVFTADQQAWFLAIPSWVKGVWGAQSVLALFGGLALLWGARTSVWALGFAFILNAVLTVWLVALASPPMQSVTGWFGVVVMAGSLILSLCFWLYARGEKQNRDGVL